MATYSIKDIEHLSGIKAHTLRIWEKRYNILEPKRTLTNIRYYDDDDLKKVLNISVLNKYGYKISNIASLRAQEINNEILNVTSRYGDLQTQIENLILAMVDFDKEYFDKVFNKSVLSRGLEETMLKVIYPFFEKIGILWQTGNVNPAQEHFISNLIRQKLIVAIDDLPEYNNSDTKKFILFLPDGEWHELGLLFYSYLIKKSGHQIIYLGSSLPLQSIFETAEQINFDYLVTSYTITLSDEQFKEYISGLAVKYDNKTILLLGQSSYLLSSKLPSNVLTPNDLKAFKEILY